MVGSQAHYVCPVLKVNLPIPDAPCMGLFTYMKGEKRQEFKGKCRYNIPYMECLGMFFTLFCTELGYLQSQNGISLHRKSLVLFHLKSEICFPSITIQCGN